MLLSPGASTRSRAASPGGIIGKQFSSAVTRTSSRTGPSVSSAWRIVPSSSSALSTRRPVAPKASAGVRTGRKHILSILVENKPGVLTRIAGLFARRGFNIDTLAVGPTDDESLSRITLTLDGAMHPIDQVTKQLHKLVNVIKIRDLEPAETVARELALFKVSADGANRAEVMQMVEIFRGKIIDVSKRSVIVEVTGSWDKIEAFERMVRPFGLIEMARTGEIAIPRGRSET